jgi:hypothetical protein
MIKHIKKVLSLFAKPKEEFQQEAWPFPVESTTTKKTVALKKATTRKPKAVAKKATKVVKKATKAKTK